jgi:hypothetical protein
MTAWRERLGNWPTVQVFYNLLCKLSLYMMETKYYDSNINDVQT